MKEFVISEAKVETAVWWVSLRRRKMNARLMSISTNWHFWLRQRGGSSEKVYAEVADG